MFVYLVHSLILVLKFCLMSVCVSFQMHKIILKSVPLCGISDIKMITYTLRHLSSGILNGKINWFISLVVEMLSSVLNIL